MRMTVIKHPDQFLIFRHNRWNYHRRVPGRFAAVDSRRFVRMSLGTDSLDVARMRRDALVQADDEYWTSLLIATVEGARQGGTSWQVAEKRYLAASTRAMAYGFKYSPAATLTENADTEEIVERAKALKSTTQKGGTPRKRDVEALLGGVERPKDKTKVSQAFQMYLEEIAFDEQYNKSPKQKYSWEKTKRTSINYFIEVIGDLPMREISREDALAYRNWWMERMIPSDQGEAPVKPNTANRHVGNMRTLFETYFRHVGEEERINPFRRLFFKGESRADVPPFENDFVRSRILKPGVFDDLRWELRCIIFTLIETGCRTSEVCNLLPEDICLNVDVPFIRIRPRQNREIKTETSIRDVPLVGVALEAMKRAPEGFEHYRDKGELVSSNLLKAFRLRELFPTSDHVIYSFRHAFEKRMLEANLDYGLRCTLMGHKTDRPAYGDGGSMAFRRDELLKIAHPYSPELFAKSDWPASP